MGLASGLTTAAVVGGTGALGRGLAARLASAGVRTVVGSRDAARAASLAATIGKDCDAELEGASNADAARAADVVFVCVPFGAQAQTIQALAGSLHSTTVLVDATVPLATAAGGRPTHALGVWHGSAAEQARALVPPSVPVIAALHTVSGAMLSDLSHVLDEDVPLCGDDPEAKRAVAALISRIPRLRPIDAGPLEMARIVERITPLIIQMNIRYRVSAGLRFTGLPDALWPDGKPA